MKTPGNGDMEIITILEKLQIFWDTESRPILHERFQRLANKKWAKLKNLLSRVYYLHGDYELRIIIMRIILLLRNSTKKKIRMIRPF